MSISRLKLSFDFVSFIAIDAPSDECKPNVKDMVYAKLVSMADSCEITALF